MTEIQSDDGVLPASVTVIRDALIYNTKQLHYQGLFPDQYMDSTTYTQLNDDQC